MEKKHFEKLTPINDIKLNGYEEALNFVFENDDIKNIAISGPYSAGKSSVIESYKKKSEKRFLHISLANFETFELVENEESNSNDESKGIRVSESVLEGKILNQLIHQIDIKNIPQTNFRVKRSESNKKVSIITTIIIILIISLLHIKYFEEWSQLIKNLLYENSIISNEAVTTIVSNIKNGEILFFQIEKGILTKILEFTITPLSILISVLITFIIMGIIIYNIVNIERNKSIFKRLSFQGNEIEIFEKGDESYFDKYLNEVLYIFENSEVDVIVFEDIDRYNSNKIFQRLREVNTLVNIKRKKNNMEPLRFFYLIKDDIFVSKDRTKFFDFIIPIIPVVDSSNSYDKFISHFKKAGILDEFEETFLQGIALYVDDMRLLKNIYNEFIIYYERIGNIEQDYNKLLAIIVYKNIFPRDFSDTQINIGFISTLFSNKEKMIIEITKTVDEDIKKLEEKVVACESEHLKNYNELKVLFSERDFYGNIKIKERDPEFIARKEILELRENEKENRLMSRIAELEKEKSILKSKKIKELITRDNIDDIFDVKYENFIKQCNDFKEIKSSQYFDLIKYLIRNGYIDETYADYMTYFYPNSLTTNDKIFLRSITDMKAKEWDYKIDNVTLVLSKLKQFNFKEEEVLNFDIFTAILDNNKEEFINTLFEQLISTQNYKFNSEYFNKVNNHKNYLKALSKYWPSFIGEIQISEEFSLEDKINFIMEVIYLCSDEEIDRFNHEKCIGEYISKNNSFLITDSPNIQKLIAQFIRLNVKFKELIFDNNDELIQEVYKNNLYEITFENISMLLINKFNINNLLDIKEKGYTIIIENEITELAEYLNDNIEKYINIILDNCEGVIRDSIEAIKFILNNEDIESEAKEQYIQYLKTDISDIREIEDVDLWSGLLESGIIKFNEINFLNYYFKSGNKLDDLLINYINNGNNRLILSSENIDNEFNDGSSEKLFNDLIKEEKINNDKYEEFITQLEYYYDEFTIEKLSKEKIKILIDFEIIEMTVANLEFFRKCYKEQVCYFIEKNIKKYLDNIIIYLKITHDELINLLDSNIEEEDKIELLKSVDYQVSIKDKGYPDNIKKYILQNNFYEDELISLVEKYDENNIDIKNILSSLCVDYKETIIESELKLNKDIFNKMFISEKLIVEEKINLLVNNIEQLSKEECEGYFNIIGENEYAKIFNNRRPKIEVSDINEVLLEAAKKRGFIKEYKENDDFYKISKIQKRRS
ncbi:hypothetical protein [Paraclostridium bifermentans]|uniref:YobI family P-loop NTPase n=1 Tax=Paraclostridium bifermentans TaxID=1490 RepID=UPI00189E9A86|nr:hypothetical protein [Paraclostridium bifermentans]